MEGCQNNQRNQQMQAKLKPCQKHRRWPNKQETQKEGCYTSKGCWARLPGWPAWRIAVLGCQNDKQKHGRLPKIARSSHAKNIEGDKKNIEGLPNLEGAGVGGRGLHSYLSFFSFIFHAFCMVSACNLWFLLFFSHFHFFCYFEQRW